MNKILKLISNLLFEIKWVFLRPFCLIYDIPKIIKFNKKIDLLPDQESWHITESHYGFKCKVGDIVEYDYQIGYYDHKRYKPGYCIVLDVTKKMMKKGIDCALPGLHGFYGKWYGEDIMNEKSYGKIHMLCDTFYQLKVIGNVNDNPELIKYIAD